MTNHELIARYLGAQRRPGETQEAFAARLEIMEKEISRRRLNDQLLEIYAEEG
jgi:hypothetical protein